MMTLQQLLPDVTLPASAAGVVLSGLQLDSRNVAPGDLFLAVPGVASDGRQFVSQAIAAGAVAVLADAETFEIQQDLNDILLHALDSRILVLNSVNLNFGNGAAGHGREKDATQGVT